MPIERLSIFDFQPEMPITMVNTKAEKKEEKKNPVKAGKKEVPACLKELNTNSSFADFIRSVGRELGFIPQIILRARRYGYSVPANHFVNAAVNADGIHPVEYVSSAHDGIPFNRVEFQVQKSEHEFPVLYFEEDGTAWTAKLVIETQRLDANCNWQMHCFTVNMNTRGFGINVFALSAWKQCRKLVDLKDALILNSYEDICKILKNKNKWAYEFLEEKGVHNPAYLLIAPQVEQLSKAGFIFADFIVRDMRYEALSENNVDFFNRLTQPATKPKDIFKCSKVLWQALKPVDSLARWDCIRKMEKTYPLSKDALQQVVDGNYSDKDMEKMRYILNRRYNGKPIFSWDSLQNYLRRLDMYQAIGLQEALMLLKDYLSMCQTLGVEPRIDSDSLKREHDVTARTLRERRDEIRAEKMKSACDYLAVNNYFEAVYFIRGIESYDDLIDEAKQQRNCVASYADAIVSRHSLIYVMRETKHPDRSLITVELSPDCSTIRQKFLACNQQIRNKAQTEFLDRWLNLCKKRKATGAESIEAMVKERKTAL